MQKKGPANTLEYLVRDVVPRMPKGYHFTLMDIGDVVNQLMGSGFRSSYSKRKFRLRYDYTMQSQRAQQLNGQQFVYPGNNGSGGTGAQSPAKGPINRISRGLQKTNTETSFKVQFHQSWRTEGEASSANNISHSSTKIINRS